MPTYQYTAKDHTGQTVSGSLDAADERATAQALRNQGLWPLRIAPSARRAAAVAAPTLSPAASPRPAPAPARPNPGIISPAPAATGAWSSGSVRLQDQVVFFRQLATAVHSGMPLGRSVDVIRQQSSGTLARVAAETAESVSRGEPLSASFARYPRVFSPLVLAMVRAGEVGGMLDNALARIADTLERQHELNQRIRRQTFYPKFILCFALLLGIAVNLIIIGINQGTNAVAAFALKTYGIPLACLTVGLLTLPRLVRGLQTGFLDPVKLALPLTGKVVRQFAVARFARAFAGLYRAGVSLPEALAASAEASGNRVIASALRAAIPEVQRGGRLSDTLGPARVLPNMALNMLRTGEETGNLDDMLDKVADYSEAEAETSIRQMVTLLGPLLLIIIGVGVGVVVARFYLGYFNQILSWSGEG